VVPTNDLKIIVSNIGTTPGFFHPQSELGCPSTAFVQVGLNEGHRLSSFEYMDLVRAAPARTAADQRLFPDRRAGGCHSEPGHAGTTGHSGERMDMSGAHEMAAKIARQVRALARGERRAGAAGRGLSGVED
jgi:hypothetical protein